MVVVLLLEAVAVAVEGMSGVHGPAELVDLEGVITLEQHLKWREASGAWWWWWGHG